jgi:uncharacterized protein HemX
MTLDISMVVAVIAVALSVFLGLKKQPHEAQSLDGDAAKNFAEAANAMALRNKELLDELKANKQQFIDFERRIEDLEKALRLEQERSNKLENWARRLVGQLQSLDAIAVPFEQYPKEPDTVKRPK